MECGKCQSNAVFESGSESGSGIRWGLWEKEDSWARRYSWYSRRRALKRASVREWPYGPRGGGAIGGPGRAKGPKWGKAGMSGAGRMEGEGMEAGNKGGGEEGKETGTILKYPERDRHTDHVVTAKLTFRLTMTTASSLYLCLEAP